MSANSGSAIQNIPLFWAYFKEIGLALPECSYVLKVHSCKLYNNKYMIIST